MKRILIIRLSAIGDVLFTLPAVAALAKKNPGARISWLVEDKAAAVLQHRDDLADVIVYPRIQIRRFLQNPLRWPSLVLLLVRYVRLVRGERYDRVFDFQGNLKSGIHAFLARSGKKTGFARGHAREMSHIFYSERIVPPGRAVHRVEKAFSLVFPDFAGDEIPRPGLGIPAAAARAAAETLKGLFPGESRVAVLHPGTSAFGAFKRWPTDRFGLLAARLHSAFGMPALITWGPGEKELAETAAAASGGAALVAPRTRSILELAGLISRGALFVAADSGPLHLANLQGVPCVALFGPKDPAMYRPYFQPAAVVRTGACCCPCNLRKCDDPICMTEMGVDLVFEAAARLLEESRAGVPG